MSKKMFVFVTISILLLVSVLTIKLYFEPNEIYNIVGLIIAVLALLLDLYANRQVIQYRYNNEDSFNEKKFIDRYSELNTILEYLDSRMQTIYVSGIQGIGKTLFLLKVEQVLNKKTYKLSNLNPFPIYITVGSDISVRDSIIKRLDLHSQVSNKEIMQQIRRLASSKDVVLLIDNIGNLMNDVSEFAELLISYNRKIFIIIASLEIDNKYNPILLGKFSRAEVLAVANSLDVCLSADQCQKIVDYTDGLPALIPLLVKQFAYNKVDWEQCPEVKEYIYKVITSLGCFEQKSLQLISFFNISNERMQFTKMHNFFSVITEENVRSLVRACLQKTKSVSEELQCEK